MIIFLLFLFACSLCAEIILSEPKEKQFFQRSPTGLLSIPISGTYDTKPARLDYSTNGGPWRAVQLVNLESNSFVGIIRNIKFGHHYITLKSAEGDQFSGTNSFSVGDIYVISGQSNASGRGTNRNGFPVQFLSNADTWDYSGAPIDNAESQVDYISTDKDAGGNFANWLAQYALETNVPVAFIPCAKSGSSITEWKASTSHASLYGNMGRRIFAAGGCSVVLWWQGEADMVAGMSREDYSLFLTLFAKSVYRNFGVKVMPFKLPQVRVDKASLEAQAEINSAISDCWTNRLFFLQGPDLSDMVYEDESGAHLVTDKAFKVVGYRVWEALKCDITNISKPY